MAQNADSVPTAAASMMATSMRRASIPRECAICSPSRPTGIVSPRCARVSENVNVKNAMSAGRKTEADAALQIMASGPMKWKSWMGGPSSARMRVTTAMVAR